MTGGCGAPPDDALPPVPASLVGHEEIPLGDGISSRMTRAANGRRDQLEPRWGPLQGRIYLLPADRRDDFARQIQTALSSDWRKQSIDDDPEGIETMAFAKGNRLVVYLLLDHRAGAFYPVQILHN